MSTGGTHTLPTIVTFNIQHKAIKDTLNGILRLYNTTHLRQHLNNNQDYLLFKELRRAITVWYTEGQYLRRNILQTGPAQLTYNEQLQSYVIRNLYNIDYLQTLVQHSHTLIVAKAFRTVVLTYKHLSDGFINSTLPMANHSVLGSSHSAAFVHSTPTNNILSNRSNNNVILTNSLSQTDQTGSQEQHQQVNMFLERSQHKSTWVSADKPPVYNKGTQAVPTTSDQSSQTDHTYTTERLLSIGWRTLLGINLEQGGPVTHEDKEAFAKYTKLHWFPPYALSLRDSHIEVGYSGHSLSFLLADIL